MRKQKARFKEQALYWPLENKSRNLIQNLGRTLSFNQNYRLPNQRSTSKAAWHPEAAMVIA